MPGLVGSFSLENPRMLRFVGTLQANTDVILGTVGQSAELVTATCSLDSERSPTIPVNTASVGDFNGVGSTAIGTAFDMLLTCDSHVQLHAVMTDATNPANMTDILTLSVGSKARGIGYRLLHEDSPVSYGPDSSRKGTKNQFLAWSGGPGLPRKAPVTLRFSVLYVQTEDVIEAGTADAVATITFSYQ